MIMANTLRIATLACAGLTAGALAAGGLVMSDSDSTRTASVTVAVALPHAVPSTNPAVDLAPSLPNTPPLPQRSPSVAPMNIANAKTDSQPKTLAEAAAIQVAAKPAAVRAGPSADAPLLYGFPAGRELREIGRDGDFVRVADVESGAQGWVARSALSSSMLTASIAQESKPVKRVKQASVEIDTPKPVTGIPSKQYRPMMLGGGSDEQARSSGSKTNFAAFLNRAFR
ncbi:hypothetical protein AUC69_13945 [Methyloceanibacter superfactus]|uniref:SH3b domain-containing protein n=2 Tax=Methyloceanibacter superfactus TaxID=1774969 RepID=A0A1E3VT33_9HYPH|nr:hypothetical protein AUC69_13945 [Methyloceanibacter superfactus]